MRFTLVDRIVELEKGQSISTVKNLSLAEEYLQDHFPGFAVLPGVMMVEALVQSGAWLMRATDDFRCSTILLKEAKAVKFNSFVTPGHQLQVDVKTHKWGENECTFKCTSRIDGDETAVSARITLQQFNLAERNPSLTSSDDDLKAKMRELFNQLYQPATD